MMQRILLSLCCSLLCWWSSIQTVSANFLDAPNLAWTFELEASESSGSRSLRQGNAVVAWQGGDQLFVTADDASLHILSLATATGEPTTTAVFEPSPLSRTYSECRSGVAVVERTYDDGVTAANNLTYLLYAVVDTPEATLVDVDQIVPWWM